MIGSYAAKCQGKPKPWLSNRNEPAAVWQSTGYLKVIHIRCWKVLQHLKFKAGNLKHTASVLYWAEQFKADWNLLRPTSFGSEMRPHNILTVWLACWGVDVLAFPPGLAAPSSSNCRSVSTPTPKESAWALRRTGITFHVGSIDAKSAKVLILHLTFARRSPWLGSEQDQERHRSGLHQSCSPGPRCHGNGFSTIDLLHDCRVMLLNTVQLWLHGLAKRQETNLPSENCWTRVLM